jgi:hypothetical protein
VVAVPVRSRRYRHPDNASQQWTGRGRQPKWVKEWVEGGKSLDKLRVDSNFPVFPPNIPRRILPCRSIALFPFCSPLRKFQHSRLAATILSF